MTSRSTNAPIVFFGFNRPKHTRLALSALAQCHGAAEHDFVAFVDGSRSADDAANVKEVCSIVASQTAFRSVRLVHRERNIGCAANIAAAVDEMLASNHSAIFIEDDIICAPEALTFFEDALRRYRDAPAVMAVCAYSYPEHLFKVPKDYDYDVYFTPGFFSWGWATWRRAMPFIDWKAQDYEDFAASPTLVRNLNAIEANLATLLAWQQRGETDDWVAPLVLSQFRNHFVSVCPVQSLVDNIGHDGSGIHCHRTALFRNAVTGEAPVRYPDYVFVDDRIRRRFHAVLSRNVLGRVRRRALDFQLSAHAWLAAAGLI